MRILLAEDERSLSRAMMALLERNHYSADAVYDGEEALAYLECGNYDALILDLMMPKLDGLSVLRRLREGGNRIPVLILTAKSEVDDKVLGLDVFPEEAARKESAFYLTKLNPYGCPLDERHSYTKVDWSIWSAALSGDKETFGKMVVPLYRFMDETTNRRPMTDWTNTDRVTAAGYKGRNVVGACFMPILEDYLSSEK